MKTVRCPKCGKPTQYSSENQFRPFCSERCQILDLGAWADELYRVPVNQNSDEEDAAADELPGKDDLN